MLGYISVNRDKPGERVFIFSSYSEVKFFIDCLVDPVVHQQLMETQKKQMNQFEEDSSSRLANVFIYFFQARISSIN
jgi:hypothetical protein